jgi:hypothetical protein
LEEKPTLPKTNSSSLETSVEAGPTDVGEAGKAGGVEREGLLLAPASEARSHVESAARNHAKTFSLQKSYKLERPFIRSKFSF